MSSKFRSKFMNRMGPSYSGYNDWKNNMSSMNMNSPMNVMSGMNSNMMP